MLKTDHVDLWQVHNVMNRDDIDKILAPGGVLEAFESAKKASVASSDSPDISIPKSTRHC
ncbi:MAG: hypothetical protein IPM55_09210 [Acidobacteria bacterium]|nr:hypothetical protein [Acidobacteriota bacterium]